MPIRVYECPKCHEEYEKLIITTLDKKDDIEPLCFLNGCEGIQTISKISACGFSLKGSGWAKDGYKS